MSTRFFANSVVLLCVTVCCLAIADSQNETGRQAYEIQRKCTCDSLLVNCFMVSNRDVKPFFD